MDNEGNGMENQDNGELKNKKDEYINEKERISKIEKILEQKNKQQEKNRKNEIAKAFSLVTQLGIQMACCIAIGVIAGMFLDRLLGTTPLFIISLSLFGSAAAIKVLYDISKNWRD